MFVDVDDSIMIPCFIMPLANSKDDCDILQDLDNIPDWSTYI